MILDGTFRWSLEAAVLEKDENHLNFLLRKFL
jgi:hypothetical protein